MAVFRYVGIRAADGRENKGVLDAETERDARRILKQRGVYATRMERVDRSVQGESRGGERRFWNKTLGRRRYIPPMRERIVFTRQLATLLEAGFPVIEALKSVEEQIRGGEPFRETIAEVRNAVSEGQALSDALGRFPRIFSSIYSSLVRAGERSGALDVVLERLASVMEEEARIRSRITSALIYPAVMASVGFIILVFLMTVVVPRVVVVFQDSHQTLPWVTRSLLAVSDFIKSWGVLAGVIMLGGIVLLSWWAKTPAGRPRVEQFLFALPWLGNFFLRIVTLRVSQLLGLLLHSGVPIITSLQVTAEATGFVSIRSDLLRVAQGVERGQSLADALFQTNRFPGLALRMIQAGEQSGNLEVMLDRVARLYQEEIERLSERIMQLVEPVIILLMGSVVAYVVVAVLLPIFEMNQLIR